MKQGLLLCLALLLGGGASAETLDGGRFGEVTLYRGAASKEVVLFLSGDGGWNLGVISMAQHLSEAHAVVAGIDIRHYLAQLELAHETCVSPAEDLDSLGQQVAKALSLKARPTLVGYSSGATLVYAALLQAAPGRFKGALSLGFCPDLDLKKPLCKGSGIAATPRRDGKGVLKGVNFLPGTIPSGRWISLQGALDQVCPAAPTEEFMKQVPGARLVLLPKVGHGYSVEHNWVPQYLEAFREITQGAAAAAP
jgi:pimeloyl-ACP methyl ester carboxylesterase